MRQVLSHVLSHKTYLHMSLSNKWSCILCAYRYLLPCERSFVYICSLTTSIDALHFLPTRRRYFAVLRPSLSKSTHSQLCCIDYHHESTERYGARRRCGGGGVSVSI
jgi:hypothetical protein